MTCILGHSDTGIDTSTGQYVGDPSNTEVRVLLKADSRVSYADYGFMLKHPKIFIRDDIMFGYAGMLKDAQLFQHTYYELVRPEGISDIAYIHNVLNEIIPASMQSKIQGKRRSSDNDGMGDMPTSNINLLVAYRGNLYHVDSFLCVTLLAEPFQATGSGQPTALGAYSMARQCGLLDPDEEGNVSLDRYSLIDIIMDAVCEMHTGCAGPFCMVEQIYNKETGETKYNVLESYSEIDTIFTKSFQNDLSITYENEPLSMYDKAHTPPKKEIKRTSKATPRTRSKTTAKK
jgi:20S proteasome alpha/beta subunit